MATARIRWLLVILPLAVVSACSRDSVPVAAPDATPPATTTGLTRHRVHAHTRLTERSGTSPAFTNAAAGAADLRARVLVRHVKSGAGDPMWPSRVPVGQDGEPVLAARADDVRPMVERARAAGVSLIGYYWFMSDDTVERLHPDWRCLDEHGRPAAHMRGTFLDITSGYREIVLARLLELAEHGVDGIYFDSTHMPAAGCRGSALAASYERQTGRKVPPRPAAADPAHWQFLAYQAEAVAQTFAYWRSAVQRSHPGVAFIVSTAGLPALSTPAYSLRLPGVADMAKTEFTLALLPGQNRRVFDRNPELAAPPRDLRMAFGWSLLRDMSGGAPPHVWSVGFETRNDLLLAAGAVLTWGGIFNLDIDEELLRPDAHRKRADADVNGLFATGDRLGELLGTATPVRWAAVHVPEAARNVYLRDAEALWRNVLWPTVGGFGAFVRAGVPVGIVGDDELAAGALDGSTVLYLPAPQSLDDKQRRAVSSFSEQGGVVIEADPAWNWPMDAKNAQVTAPDALIERIDALADQAPVRVVSKDRTVHGVTWRSAGDEHLIVVLSGEFLDVDVKLAGRALPSDTPLVPVDNVEVIVRAGDAAAAVHDGLSGQPLSIRRLADARAVVVPAYEHLAVLVVSMRR